MSWMRRVLSAVVLLSLVPCAWGTDLSAQRAAFKQAWTAAQQGQLAKLTPYLNQLADYPLYPYLRFAYLNATLAQQPAGAIQAFLKQQAQLPVAETLRQDWLLKLAQSGDWKTFLAHYRNETTPALRCAAISAHLLSGAAQDRGRWVAAAQNLWLAPLTQPSTCGPAFDYLKAHHRINNDMRVQRVQAALQAGNDGLARRLMPQLNDSDRPWARIWLDVAADPAQVLSTIQVPDEPKYLPLLLDGVQRVASKDPARARHLWHELSRHYHFSTDQVRDMRVRLALEYAWHHLPQARQMLANAPQAVDPRITEWRIRTALRHADWKSVLALMPALGALAAKPEWRYWKARALAAVGRAQAATDVYQNLADGMGYYGFLAADHLGLNYAITQETSQPSPAVMARLAQRPGLVRARELFYADLYNYANAEWQAATAALPKPAHCQAALLAEDWGWYGRAIRSFANAGCWQDLTVNYPLAYNDVLAPRTQALDLSLAWVYGVIRAESVFRPDAVSAAGAIGLMQLMPATGRQVAARLDLVLESNAALQNPRVNLTLGSAYLSHLLKRFKGSEALATAAYNAGARHVVHWLPHQGELPGDVWVDTIPYPETRDYVRRVLSQAVIFGWRLHQDSPRLSARLGTITAAPTAASAALVQSAATP